MKTAEFDVNAGVVEGTNTIQFINTHEIPDDRFKDRTYGQIMSVTTALKKKIQTGQD